MNAKSICCHKCKHVWEFEPPMGRRTECPSCEEDSRVCLNCRFYDRSAYRECREEQSEWVKEKNSGNFCGFFEANARAGGGNLGEDLARSKLDSLFGGAATKAETRRSTDASPKHSADSDASQETESLKSAEPAVSLKDELAKFLNSKK